MSVYQNVIVNDIHDILKPTRVFLNVIDKCLEKRNYIDEETRKKAKVLHTY